MNQNNNSTDIQLPESQIDRPRFSWVWLVPIAALIIALWLGINAYLEKGVTVTIHFNSASGVSTDSTKVKFKDAVIGKVNAIDIDENLTGVNVTVELQAGFEDYLTEDAHFWIERPRVSMAGVSGLDTILSGGYVAFEPGSKNKSAKREYIGLEKPPEVATSEKGTIVHLRSKMLGSLNIGSAVYYRQINVGRIVDYKLAEDGQWVDITAFIPAPNDRLLRPDTRFWNVSGLSFEVSGSGAKFDMQSLASVVTGGVAFDSFATLSNGPEPEKNAAGNKKPSLPQYYVLYDDQQEAENRRYNYKEYYLVRFDNSTSGLQNNSVVSIKGFPVGRVSDYQLRYDPKKNSFYTNVLVEIEPERISITDSNFSNDPKAIRNIVQNMIRQGLQAQLQVDSLLTSSMRIELDFAKDQNGRLADARQEISYDNGYVVIPSRLGKLDTLEKRIETLISKVEKIPVEEIGSNLVDTLAGLRQTVKAIDSSSKQAAKVMENVNNLTAPSSPLTIGLGQALKDMSNAARSVQRTADYLDRHPESLIRGKQQ